VLILIPRHDRRKHESPGPTPVSQVRGPTLELFLARLTRMRVRGRL